jgi:hypothetical protein
LKFTLARKSPDILVGVGLAGLVSSTIMAVKATPKALKLQEEANAITPKEKVVASWKCYIPTAITMGLSIGCVLGGHNINLRRNAALATAYSLSEQALQDYHEKVTESIGPKKEQNIIDKVQQKTFKESDAYKTVNNYILTGDEILCFDAMSRRTFVSTQNKIDRIILDLNQQLNAYDAVEVDDWYRAIGLNTPDLAKNMYWYKKSTTYNIEPTYSYDSTDDGKPCLLVGFYFDSKPVSDDPYCKQRY